MERHQLDYSHHPFSQPRLENTFTKNPLGNVHTQIHAHTHTLCLLRCVVFNHILTHFNALQETVTFQTLKISQAFFSCFDTFPSHKACMPFNSLKPRSGEKNSSWQANNEWGPSRGKLTVAHLMDNPKSNFWFQRLESIKSAFQRWGRIQVVCIQKEEGTNTMALCLLSRHLVLLKPFWNINWSKLLFTFILAFNFCLISEISAQKYKPTWSVFGFSHNGNEMGRANW